MTAPEKTFSWYPVPEDIKKLLVLATAHWDNTTVSEAYIQEALVKAGDNPDVLVTAYRYFFYKNKPQQALDIAHKVLAQVCEQEQLPADWQHLKPVLIERQHDPQIRLYLNAYAASGLVLARLGDTKKALEVSERVKEIDQKNEFGATVIVEILTKPEEEED